MPDVGRMSTEHVGTGGEARGRRPPSAGCRPSSAVTVSSTLATLMSSSSTSSAVTSRRRRGDTQPAGPSSGRIASVTLSATLIVYTSPSWWRSSGTNAMPRSSAWYAPRPVTSPCRVLIVPVVARRSPATVSANDTMPLPPIPASPTISWGRTVER